MTEPVRIGMIGVGQIGNAHLRRYADIKGADIVAAADIDEAALARAAGQYGIADTYTDFRELIARDDIRAVDVCLHNNLHMPVSVEAMNAGRDVYCEKPIAGSYADGVTMCEAARNLGRKLHIQLGRIFDKEAKAAKRLIDDGHLGRIYYSRSTGYRRRGRPFVDGYGTKWFVEKEMSGGGALFDMGVYHISQLLYLLGMPKVSRVTGKLYQEMDMDARRRAESEYDVEELAVGLVTFEDGCTMDIIEAWAMNLDALESSYLLGSKGGIRLKPFSYHSTLSDMDMDATFNLDRADFRQHQLEEDADAYDSPQHHWIAALQGRVPLLPCAEIALQTMMISEALRLSDERGREVTAGETAAESKSTAVEI
jgi:predicted dehydrogenase